MVEQEKKHSDEGGESMHEAEAKARIWANQNETVDLIWHGGVRDVYVPATEVGPQDLNIECMDERVLGNKVGIAGSGVLLNTAEQALALEMIQASGRKITGVGRHSSCGAEGMAQKKPFSLSDEQIDAKAKSFAEMLGVPFTGFAPMTDTHFHPARVLTIAATLDFDITKVRGAHSFLVSARYTPTAITEADIGIGIALGDHGIGMFSPAEPLAVVIIGDRENRAYHWEKLKEQLHEQPNMRTNFLKVFITGFNA